MLCGRSDESIDLDAYRHSVCISYTNCNNLNFYRYNAIIVINGYMVFAVA